MIDERHEEAASLYALGLLEGAERTAFETELARDAELRGLVAQLRAASAQLAHAAPPADPSPFLRERVLAAMPRTAATANPNSRNGFGTGWAAAACFALCSGVLAWQAHRQQNDLAQARAETLRAIAAQRTALQTGQQAVREATQQLETLRTALRDQRTQSAREIALLREQANVAELKIQSLASLAGNSPQARAIAVWNPFTQQGVLTVANLPALEANKDYQLWLLEPQSDTPVDAGTFRVDPATGETRITFKPTRAVRAVDKFAVSLEQKGGSTKPLGPVVLLGQ